MEKIVADHVATNPRVECVLGFGIHRAPQTQGHHVAKQQESNHVTIVRK
jgi:hypothetical protein